MTQCSSFPLGRTDAVAGDAFAHESVAVEPGAAHSIRSADVTAARLEKKTGSEPSVVSIRTTRLTHWDSLPGLQAAWSDLLDRSPAYSVFQTYPWHSCWWKAFGASHELLVILAYSGSRLVGIAPMMIVRSRGAIGQTQRQVHFIGSLNDVSDYCDFITDPDFPEALTALLDDLCAGDTAFGRIDLSHFPGHSPNQVAALDYFTSRGLRTCLEFHAEAPARILGDLQADTKAANKTSLKRHTAFFRKQGDLRFHRCTSAGEVLGYLDGFFDQHMARWSRTGSPSQFADPAQRGFFRELISALFPHGWLKFDVVLFNDAPLAFHFGFEYRRRFIWYKPTFDIRLASRSPGEVLIKYLLEDAIKRGLEEFDFTVGAESFKYRFANCRRSNNRMIVFRGGGDYWTYRARRHVKRLLKRLLRREISAPQSHTAD